MLYCLLFANAQMPKCVIYGVFTPVGMKCDFKVYSEGANCDREISHLRSQIKSFGPSAKYPGVNQLNIVCQKSASAHCIHFIIGVL